MIARPYDMMAYSPAVNSAAMPIEIKFWDENTSARSRLTLPLLHVGHREAGVPRLGQFLRPNDPHGVARRVLHHHVRRDDLAIGRKPDHATGQQRVPHHDLGKDVAY